MLGIIVLILMLLAILLRGLLAMLIPMTHTIAGFQSLMLSGNIAQARSWIFLWAFTF